MGNTTSARDGSRGKAEKAKIVELPIRLAWSSPESGGGANGGSGTVPVQS